MNEISMKLISYLTILGGATYGLSISSLSEEFITANTGHVYSSVPTFLLSNSNLFGTFASSFCMIFIAQKLQKWKLLLLGLILSSVFNFLLIFSVLLPYYGWAYYYGVCNFCFNFFIAFYIVTFPVVVAELADKYSKHRGYLLIMLQLAIAIGGFVRKGLELFVEIPYDNERSVESAKIVFAVQFCLSFVCSLLLLSFLLYLHRFLPFEQKMAHSENVFTRSALQSIFFSPEYRYALLLAIAIGPLQQFTGINMMLYNDFSVKDAMKRLTQQEIKSRYAELTWALKMQEFMGYLLNITGVAFTIPFIEKFGRRTLLLSGSRAIVILLILLGIGAVVYSFAEVESSKNDIFQRMTLEILDALRVLFMFCFEFGPGCVFWVVVGEYFPYEYRMTFSAIAFCGNWGTSVLQLGFSSLIENQVWVVYLIDALLLFLWTFVVDRSMPEATGLKLEDIQDQYYDFDEKRSVMV